MAQKAYSQVWKSITGVPAADLRTKRYLFMKYDADGKINVAGATDAPVGVLYDPRNTDQPAQVVTSGFAFITLGAELTPGTPVKVDANGKAVAATIGTDHVAGILHVGGVADAIGTVLLK